VPDLHFLDFQVDLSSPRTVSAYDELPLWSAMFGLLLLEEVPLAGVTTVLDVGCGTGFPLIELAERLGPSARVCGIDPWSAGTERARAKVAARETPNVEIHEGSAASMPFPDAAFDLIVSNLGVNNFDDRQVAIRECRRVARVGGTLALTSNLQGHMQELYAAFADLLEEDHDTGGAERLREHVEHRATVESIRRLVEGHRFAVRRVVERSAVMRFADGTALFHHHFIKLGFLEAWKEVVPGRERHVFTRLQDRLNDIARRNGELRLTIPMAYVEAVAEA
jgi:arsenite methyltransferase